MVQEVLGSLITDSGGVYVDGTVGSGGHSVAIGREITDEGRLICLDRDPAALELSKRRLAFLGQRVTLVKSNYAEIDEVIPRLGIQEVDGILLDLGMSTYQLDHSGRGFSFSRDEPLDMRMDPTVGPDASELVNTLSQIDLERILRDYGEERRAKVIARSILRERKKKG